MGRLQWGMWIWGGATVVLALGALALVVAAGLCMDESGSPAGMGVFGGIYKALGQNENLVAGILGFSGLAWAHFFTAAQDKPEGKAGRRRK